MSTLSGLIEELNAVKNKFRTEGKAAIHAALQEVFEKHPKLESFSWTQYTPYFNDGEPCYFSVGEIEDFKFDGEENPETYAYQKDASGQINWRLPVLPIPGKEEAHAASKAICSLSSLLRKADEALEAVFGDHVKVTVTRDGISVDEYDHD